MTVSPRARRTRRLVLVGLFVVAAALVAGTTGATRQNDDDPRNYSYGLVYRGGQQDCWKHHRSDADPMRDTHIVVPLFPKAIKVGERTDLELQVENAWKHEIAAIKVVVKLLGNETHLVPLTEGTAEEPPLDRFWTGVLGHKNVPDRPAPASPHPEHEAQNVVTIGDGALAMYAWGEFYWPPGSGAVLENRARFYTIQPHRTVNVTWPGNEPGNATWDLHVPRPVAGTWTFGVEYERGGAPELPYALNVTVVYGTAGEGEHEVLDLPRSPQTPPATLVVPRGVTDVLKIPVRGLSEGRQTVEVNVTALIYYDHQAGGTPDEDSFYRVATREIVVGDEFIPGDAVMLTGNVVRGDPYLVLGEITGYASAFLLVPSLVLGGTYGRGSRQFLNLVLGGAKRRVMFHNLVSMGLTLIALVHVVLFLLEVRYTVMMGILWGGLGLLGLLVLGLTGYYQVPLIQKYGYGWWRNLHLACGILVVVFVGWHAIQDGADFFFLKEQLPGWLQDLNWARMENIK